MYVTSISVLIMFTEVGDNTRNYNLYVTTLHELHFM